MPRLWLPVLRACRFSIFAVAEKKHGGKRYRELYNHAAIMVLFFRGLKAVERQQRLQHVAKVQDAPNKMLFKLDARKPK
jgi:hypothetical protein